MKTTFLLTGVVGLFLGHAVNAAVTYHVYATREGLVGGKTANGHVIAANDHFCALPSGTVLNSNGGTTYTVSIRNPANGHVANNVPVWDIGPWNTKDNYWHTPRAEFATLAQGTPEAQAAYQTGFNGGKDEFGRSVSNPAGIDLADGTFNDLGSPTWVDVTYNWETGVLGGADAVSRFPGNIELFVRSLDGHLKSKTWANTWSGWNDFANNCTSDPGVVCMNSNRLDIFWRGTDGTLNQKTWTAAGGWAGNISLGGQLVGGPSVCSIFDNRLDVFCRGTQNELEHRTWTSAGGWSGWESLGGVLASDPAALAWNSGNIQVFVQDTTGALNQKFWTSTGGWSGWTQIGGQMIGAPTVCSRGANNLEIFCRGTQNALEHISWSPTGWSGWESLGGVLTSDPGCSTWGGNRIDVFVRGANATLDMEQITWTGTGGWSGWFSLGN